ncbi:MAG: SDR family oxidoreductase [Hyphomicrobiales bacterium]|nr:SDR family oxidoreductase [Hyphomicrobiales bacterium]
MTRRVAARPPGSALVTGGARRIGRAIVEALAEKGAAVAIHCHHSQDEAHSLAESVATKGVKAKVITADLADPHEVAGLVARAERAVGKLNLLVNNAAVFEQDDIKSLDAERFDRQVAINLRAPLLLSREFAKRAVRASLPAIINIIDQRVLKTDPRCFSYGLTKSALWSATRMMAQAFAPTIRVNAVAPGPTFPNLREGDEGVLREAQATLLAKRVRPEAIAAAVLYLTSAQHVTGQLIAVDSGQHLGWMTPDVMATMGAGGALPHPPPVKNER